MRSFAALICGCSASRAGFICVPLWFNSSFAYNRNGPPGVTPGSTAGEDAATTCISSITRLGLIKQFSFFGQQARLGRRLQVSPGLRAVTGRLQNQPVVTRHGGGLEFLRI